MEKENNYRESYVELLGKLVSIKSPYFHEDEIMEYVCGLLRERGLDASIHEFYEGKETMFHGKNVVGKLDSGKPGPTIYLGGHLDTVNLCEGWTKEPYGAEIEDGYMYGVGALDMKAGDAAIITAVSRFFEKHGASKDFRGKIIYHFVSDEEGPYGLGTTFIVNDGIHNIAEEVDFAIMAEPSAAFTGNPHPDISVGARGGYNYTIKLHGRASHAATPQLGINAAADASRIILALEELETAQDDKLGKSKPCVIRVSGGGDACSVPDYAEVEVFHHTVRGETLESLKKQIEELIERVNPRSEAELIFRQSPAEGFDGGFKAYCIDEDDPMLEKLNESVEAVCGKKAGLSYFQAIGDFNIIGGTLGLPTVLLGPDGDNFHGADERVKLDSAFEVEEIIYDFLEKMMAEE